MRIAAISGAGLLATVWATLGSAQGMQWPISAPGEIAHAYGQYQGGSVQYMHLGIDIPGPLGTAANWYGNGTVIKAESGGPTPADGIVEITDGTKVWRYLHVEPTVTLNQMINGYATVGTLARFQGPIPPHLHLEILINGIYDDPLLHLADVVQKAKPSAPTAVWYRKSPGPAYFTRNTCSGAVVISGATDIVARATDGFRNIPPSRTSVHSLSFSVDRDGVRLIGETAFRFGAGARNIKLPFLDLGTALLPVIYARDPFAKTTDADPQNVLHGNHDFYYFLTNIGDDRNVIRPADADKYWNTKVERANDRKWNTAGYLANANHEALFFDNEYKVNVWSRDEKGTYSSPARSRAFVNNFDELLVVGNILGQPLEEFAAGAQVIVSGHRYPAGRNYRIHLMAGQNLNDCTALSNQIVASVTTNADGAIPAAPIILPAGFQAGAPHLLVLDYDGDGKYTGLREGHTVDVISSPFVVGQ
jgi:hypothetical protein